MITQAPEPHHDQALTLLRSLQKKSKRMLKLYASILLLAITIINTSKSRQVQPHQGESLEYARTAIYLTIDDGPSIASFDLSNTVMHLKTPVTVFIIGNRVYGSEAGNILFQLYQLNPYIEVGNHSFWHAHSHYREYYSSPADVINDFRLNADTLDLHNYIARLPGRNTWRINGRAKTDLPDDSSAADTLAADGYRIFGWDLEWRFRKDSNQLVQPATSIIKRLKLIAQSKNSFTPGHIVLLCHEWMFTDSVNKAQLDTFICLVQKTGLYTFRRLSEYPNQYHPSY